MRIPLLHQFYAAIVLSLFCFIPSLLKSQTNESKPQWKRNFQTGINYNQSSFSDEWKGGGTNTISWNALMNIKTEYTDGKYFWSNDFQSQYGQSNTKDVGVRKSFDRLFFESKASYKLSNVWNVFGALSFLTQFDDGYLYNKTTDGKDSLILISTFMAPAYVTEAFGLEYKPVSYFSAQFGIASMRQTLVLNQDLYKYQSEIYGVKKGDYLRNQPAFQFIASFDKEIYKNITLKARYMFVMDYTRMNHTGIINRLDASLVAKLTRYITFNFGSVVLYDYAQTDNIQYSQVMGVGILYSISNELVKK